MNPRGLDWTRDRRDWPNAECSRFVSTGHLRWHVQTFASGRADAPCVLLVHGTGASTHSWRDTAPALSAVADVVAVDLPGHGFTERPPPNGLSLPGMARRLAALLQTMAVVPDIVIGHSAGAAILVRMALDGHIAPREIISLNGAIYPFRGTAQRMFPGIARALFLNPLVPRLFAFGAGRHARVERLIEGTGSRLDAEGIALYARLFACSGHAGSALGMMARWDLDALDAEIATLEVPLTLVVADNDRAVSPDQAAPLAARLLTAEIVHLAALGHLAHEEDPGRTNAFLRARITGDPEVAGP
ncbi:alpha/beta fold hydrolase BchO [Salinisphaera sp. Q1T1-3]|uniref:alpha/beta fold hydrolase BchO n=1 Tax=Salinisphaera sp. Q1T1-3 TaxID=2321229 RepID=UPI000E76C3A3|nr:alpha/beta fold hydrolase BchO [Salinisphaera sp. Q1T1-3]RJS92106.1 alpha/beta fold hydrolase [Salinisphaera sp. Q1T1-3]